MVPHILILEDDSARLARFSAVLSQVAPAHSLRVWRDAHRMIEQCPPLVGSAELICLDHDLDPAPDSSGDPGDGMDVARFLSGLPPSCPVLIHSSNGDRATQMLGALQLGGWPASTILPLGAEWVERYWRRRIEELLKK